MKKNIVITVGPIPSKLDSVKFVTNRFKGGLALETAHFLSKNNNVTIVAWKFTQLDTQLPIIRVEDVIDYYNTVLNIQADAYILAAAVANLMPSNPYIGKFPSHNYQVGEKFNIEFEIAPRLIDNIKIKYPKSTLVGYKLLDGDESELIYAGKKTLTDSKANIVFANHPAWAKDKKLVLTQDNSSFYCSYLEHNQLIDKLINETFYTTQIVDLTVPEITQDDSFVIENYPKHQTNKLTYGTFAIKKNNGLITTTRGKKDNIHELSYVEKIDHIKHIVYANKKATLNAPLLDSFFKINPHFNYIYHGHDLVGEQGYYEFPGTLGENRLLFKTVSGKKLTLPHHGYIVGFSSIEDLKLFVTMHE